MNILGVSLSKTFSFNVHIDNVLRQAAQSMYALRVLRSHGLTGESLWDVTRATTLARMLYASPAWWGYIDMGHKVRLHNFLLNCGGWDFCRSMLRRSRKCVKPLTTDSSHQSSIMGTMS